MPIEHYFVVNHENEWKIRFNGEHSKPFRSQAEAIKAAVQRAKASSGGGKNAQVLVQGENHSFRTEWTYGRDPHPPPG
jgi:hypothetical protein